MPNETKGITVKIDAALHAEVKKYLEENGMTMAEFVTRAIDNELNPRIKEENKVEKMRTLAFQVPESFFQRIKDHLSRTGMSQKDFVLGLIEEELDRAEEMSAAEQTDTEGPAPEEDADGDENESETEEYPESEDVYGEEAEGDSPEEDSADYGEVYMEDLGDPDADDWYGEDADEDDTEEIGEYDEDDPEDDKDFDEEEDSDEYGEDVESEEDEEEDSLSFVRLM